MTTSKRKKKRNTIVPVLGSGILMRGVRETSPKNIDCIGVTTIFWAWAFPSIHRGHAFVSVFNLGKGKTSVAVSMREQNSRKKTSVTMFDIEADKNGSATPFIVEIEHKFQRAGMHELIISFRDFPGTLKIPFEVRSREWAKFTKKEIEYAKNNLDILPKFRINVNCPKCEHAYVFEEQIFRDYKPKGGVHRFPDKDNFECQECGNDFSLRDIQGRFRDSIKRTINKQMRGDI